MARTRPSVHTTLDPRILDYYRGSRQLGKAIDSVLLPLVEENGQSIDSLLQELGKQQQLLLEVQTRIAGINNQLQARSLKNMDAMRTATVPSGPIRDARDLVKDELDAVARRFRVWRRDHDRSRKKSKAKKQEAALTFCADTVERTPLLRDYTPEKLLDELTKATGAL